MNPSKHVQAYLAKRRRRKPGGIVESESWFFFWRYEGETVYRSKSLRCVDKQVAHSKYAEALRELEHEASGLGPSNALRDAQRRTVLEHLGDFCNVKSTQGRDSMYVYNLRNHVEKICDDCGWSTLNEICADGFEAWRADQAISPRTMNAYLEDFNALLNWLQRRGRLLENPLRLVERVKAVEDIPKIRALNDDEVVRLLGVAGDRQAVYLLALTTGLRRSELRTLVWFDVHLEAVQPYLLARASQTKNAKRATMWLRADVVHQLRGIGCATPSPAALVFAQGIPDMEVFRADLKAAGIADVDPMGRKVVFHSLRHTLATALARAKAAPRIAMELMRHSDVRLTMKTYTDAALLPTREAMEQLPSWRIACLEASIATGTTHDVLTSESGTAHGTVKGVREGQNVSSGVDVCSDDDLTESPGGKGSRSTFDAQSLGVSRDAESWGSRIRT